MDTLVYRLITRFKTRNPYKIASSLGIVILMDTLTGFNGYYCQLEGIQIICVNKELPDNKRMFVVAHFLYHAITNVKNNVTILFRQRKDAALSVYEKLGNDFAYSLLSMP